MMDDLTKCLTILRSLEDEYRLDYGFPVIELCSDGSGEIDYANGRFCCQWDTLRDMLATIQNAFDMRNQLPAWNDKRGAQS